MPIYTISPKTLVSNSGWQVRGTASSVTALSDGSDSTDVLGRSVGGDNLQHKWGVGQIALPPLPQPQLHHVTMLVRARANGQARLKFSVQIGGLSPDPDFVDVSSYVSTKAGGLVHFDYYVTQADLDNISTTMTIEGFSGGATEVQVFEYSMEVHVDLAPTVNAVRPVAYSTSPSIPVSWVYGDAGDFFAGPSGNARPFPGSESQDYSFVKAFSLAQYSIGGFSPETSPATYSQEVRSNAQSRVIPYLPDGRYRIYTKVADAARSDSGPFKRYSYWDYSELEIRNRYIQSVV